MQSVSQSTCRGKFPRLARINQFPSTEDGLNRVTRCASVTTLGVKTYRSGRRTTDFLVTRIVAWSFIANVQIFLYKA